eukprot:gene10834-292_t
MQSVAFGLAVASAAVLASPPACKVLSVADQSPENGQALLPHRPWKAVEMWAESSRWTSGQAIFQHVKGPNHNGLTLTTDAGSAALRLHIDDPAGLTLCDTAGTRLSDGAWHHLLLEVNVEDGFGGTQARVVVDGVAGVLCALAKTWAQEEAPIRLGQDTLGRVDPLSGSYGNLRMWDRFFTDAEAAVLGTAATPPFHPSSLLADYRPSDDFTMKDASLYHADSVFTSSVAEPVFAHPYVQTAFRVGGTAPLAIPYVAAHTSATAYALSFWMRDSGISTDPMYRPLFDALDQQGLNQGWQIGIDGASGHLQAQCWSTTEVFSVHSDIPVDDGSWHHVLFRIRTEAGSVSELYLDGAHTKPKRTDLARPLVASLTLDPNPILVGWTDSPAETVPFAGWLADIRLHGSPVADTLSVEFRAPTTDGLLLHYADGTVDSSGYGNDMPLTVLLPPSTMLEISPWQVVVQGSGLSSLNVLMITSDASCSTGTGPEFPLAGVANSQRAMVDLSTIWSAGLPTNQLLNVCSSSCSDGSFSNTGLQVTIVEFSPSAVTVQGPAMANQPFTVSIRGVVGVVTEPSIAGDRIKFIPSGQSCDGHTEQTFGFSLYDTVLLARWPKNCRVHHASWSWVQLSSSAFEVAGYHGAYCASWCSASMCQFHGACSSSGTCLCTPGWFGADCSAAIACDTKQAKAYWQDLHCAQADSARSQCNAGMYRECVMLPDSTLVGRLRPVYPSLTYSEDL